MNSLEFLRRLVLLLKGLALVLLLAGAGAGIFTEEEGTFLPSLIIGALPAALFYGAAWPSRRAAAAQDLS